MNGQGPPRHSYGFVTSSDSRYLRAYGPAYIESAKRTDTPVHHHIINPTKEDYNLLELMHEYWPKLSWTDENMALMPYDMRVVYASGRYHILPWLFQEVSGYKAFVMDIDSLFMKKFEFLPNDNPIGLYFRDPIAAGASTPEEMLGMRVLAVCWVWAQAKDYAVAVSEYLHSHPKRWFIDQEALAVTYDQLRDQFPATDISQRPIIDWEFKSDTFIHTGKGDRKHHNAIYLAEFHEHSVEFERVTGFKCLKLKS